MNRGSTMVVVVLGLCALLPRRAEAAPKVDLSWSAPPECPTASAIEQAIRARAPDEAIVSARVQVVRAADVGFRLRLEVVTPSSRGERVLEGSDCGALAGSAALIIAMAVAPREEAPAPSTAPAPEAATKEVPPPMRDAPWTAGLRPEFLIDVGTLPSTALGAGVAANLHVRRVAVEVFGALFAEQRTALASDPSRGAVLGLGLAGARGCFRIIGRGAPVGLDGLDACFGTHASRIAASGYGSLRPTTDASLVWALELSATSGVRLTRWLSARAGITMSLPLERESFTILPSSTIHERGAVAARAWLGPELSF